MAGQGRESQFATHESSRSHVVFALQQSSSIALLVKDRFEGAAGIQRGEVSTSSFSGADCDVKHLPLRFNMLYVRTPHAA